MTSSIGSTSLAIITSLAYLFSINVVTWFKPNLSNFGFAASFPFLLSTFSYAFYNNLVFFSFLVSGLYFFKSLKSPLAKNK